jgi:hypothetical protein
MVIDLFEIFLETFRLQVSLTAVQPYVGDGAAIEYAPKGNQENANGIHNEPKKLIIARNKEQRARKILSSANPFRCGNPWCVRAPAPVSDQSAGCAAADDRMRRHFDNRVRRERAGQRLSLSN